MENGWMLNRFPIDYRSAMAETSHQMAVFRHQLMPSLILAIWGKYKYEQAQNVQKRKIDAEGRQFKIRGYNYYSPSKNIVLDN